MKKEKKEKSESAKRYCTCRSKDSSGFMIGCENCEEWFHGRCVGITYKASKNIDLYYCDGCKIANPSLEIIYKVTETATQPEKKVIKQEPLEERKQEKKVFEKNEPTSTLSRQPKAKPKSLPVQQKTSQSKKRVNQKAKGKGARKQCGNPKCIYETRLDSKYCSDECGLAFNKLRYETHFIPKWQLLEKNHSQARLKKMKDLDQLEREKCDIESLIKNLKMEKEELEQNISVIKEQATRLCKENVSSKENHKDDAEMDNEEIQETVSGDISKTFCVTCGHTIIAETSFKHWSTCHKKHEGTYNFTADVVFRHFPCKEDENPKLYCHHQDKKTKRYCMNIESACPQHSNWHSDKDEVCGCPLNIMQKLVPDGNYCLELKKDCTQHYHWDKFRLAQINMQRVHAFTRLDVVMDRFERATKNLEDTYGGVVGVMLHNTLNHSPDKEESNESPYEQEDLDVEMNTD